MLMDKLVLFNNTTRNKLINKRSGESKFGEHVQMLTSISNIYEQLNNLDVTYVIIGFSEDVGVFANYGKTGASKAWDSFIEVLLNIQSNDFTKANKVLLLGHLDFTEELSNIAKLNQSKKKDIQKARAIVKNIDTHVTHSIHQIVLAGKKPIIIGGGHNNAYGNIKGHSGNGFSYAYAEGFLKNYFVFGLHENYTSDKLLKTLKKFKFIEYNTFETIEIRKELKLKAEMQRALSHIESSPFGIEIDCDAIENIPSSAKTPSGFSVNKTRAFVSFFAKHENARYLHICEAAPTKKTAQQVGKLSI